MADQKLTGVAAVKTPKLNALNKDPVSRSILSMLTPEENKPRTKGNLSGEKSQIPKATLERISKITSTTIDANHEMMESVPGAFKALSILQAAILSPRDLTTINLSYTSESYEGRNNDLNNLLLNKVKDYVEGNYKITDRLQDIVADLLFYKGARAIALLSSSSLDHVINGHTRASMEALSDEYRDGEFVTRGWLGDNDETLKTGTHRASLESLISGNIPGMTKNVVANSAYGITVTDNDAILRLPQLKLTLARNAMASKVRVPRGLKINRPSYGIEALDEKGNPKNKDGSRGNVSLINKLSPDQYVDVYNQLFKQRDYKQTDLVEIRRDDELSQENIDAVMWLDLPMESVVPCHLPGRPKARIGAYVLLDGDGNALSTAVSEHGYQDVQQNKSDTAEAIDGTKGIIAMAQEYRNGTTDQFSMVEFRRKVNDEIERDLVQRIVNGTFGQKVALGMTDEIKEMMFARTMRNLKTKVLFIPEESLVYFAFDYNRFGIGRSLLERSRLYASMAMANVISTTLANISASTNVTTLGIQLDPDNPEPDATVESIVTTHLNSNRTMSSLIGARNPRDVINIMDEAGVIVKTSGHPGYPDIDVDVSYDKRNVTPPDAEWNDRLLEMLWNMWGVDPALLSTQNNTQFAIEHINNNALFRKSTGMQRNMLCATLSELVQKLTAKSGNLMNDLYEIIMENKKLWAPTSKRGQEQLKELKEDHPEIENSDRSLANFILVNFINSIELTLPEPMEGDIDEQNRAYDTMRQRYESSFKDLFPDDVLSYILGDSADTTKFEAWRQNLVAHKMREWMAGSGSYEDITELCEVGDDSNAAITLLGSMVAYNEQALGGMIEYLKLSSKMKDKIKASWDKLEESGALENNPAHGGFGAPGEEVIDGSTEFGAPGNGDVVTDPGNATDSLDFDNPDNNSNESDDPSLDTGEGSERTATDEGTEGAEATPAENANAEVDPFSAAMSDPAAPPVDDATATAAETDDVVVEPELDENGNPIDPDAPLLDENGKPVDEPVIDDSNFEETKQDDSDLSFEETKHDDGELDFAEVTDKDKPNTKADDAEAVTDDESNSDEDEEDEENEEEEPEEVEGESDDKPTGRKRKSKRAEKKAAKKKAADAGDGLDFKV